MKAALHLVIMIVYLCRADICQAQGVLLEGRVIDASTNQSLPGAHVFLDQTLRGTSTDREGYFQMHRLPAGSYKVVASILGYSMETVSLEVVPEDTLYTIDFKLTPRVVELAEVNVEDRRPRGWKRDFIRFNRLFLGSSSNGRRSEIKNRYSLDFETKDNVFKAGASEPLEIENRSLGYRITFILTDFRMDQNTDLLHMQGPFYFTELESKSQKEADRWRENRAKTFRGSLQHILRSLITNNYTIQGYNIRIDDRENAPYSDEAVYLRSIEGLSIVEPTNREYLYRISFSDYLYVEYENEPSWIEMNRDEAKLHASGYVYAPAYERGALTVHGALSTRRVADLLPRDFNME